MSLSHTTVLDDKRCDTVDSASVMPFPHCAMCAVLYSLDARRCREYWISVGMDCGGLCSAGLQVKSHSSANV